MNDMALVMVDGTEIRTDNKLRERSRMHGRGQITKTLSVPPEKSMCAGCEEDFYNGQGAAECWSFKTAKVVNKVGYSSIHCANGPDTIMKATLNCWRGVCK